ncbi:MAG TPA: NrsF family protein [Lichenihabitans sp.]|jgi:hypothetical protein|nr:NrsF family protein [Lichenihabitans sp.]
MSNLDTIDHMIDRLGTDLKPVRRLRPPGVRALLWLAGVAALAGVLASFADLPAIAHRLMGAPDMWLAVLGSTLTAILGAAAVFHLSVPGRSPWWALLPVPSLLLWVGASGMGCLRTWLVPGTHDASMGEVRICLVFIVAVSIPLSALMVVMIRRACPLRPNLTAATGGLAIAAGAASLLNFFHPYDASATDLAVHLLAVAIVVFLNQLVARWALAHRRRPFSV